MFWGNTHKVPPRKEIPIQPAVHRILEEITPVTTNPDIVLSMFKDIDTSGLYGKYSAISNNLI